MSKLCILHEGQGSENPAALAINVPGPKNLIQSVYKEYSPSL